MSDPFLNIISSKGVVISADGQRKFDELREAFRAANQARVHATLRKDSVVRYHRDGTVAGRVETGLMTDAPAGRDWRTVRDYQQQGGIVPDFAELERAAFTIPACEGLDRELRDLARDAAALALHEGVRYLHVQTKPTNPLEEVEKGNAEEDWEEEEIAPDDNHPEGKSNAEDELSADDSGPATA